jgi:hypothetical protein
MYDIDMDTAADTIKGLRNAVKGVQIMCAAVIEFLSQACHLQQTQQHIVSTYVACNARL